MIALSLITLLLAAPPPPAKAAPAEPPSAEALLERLQMRYLDAPRLSLTFSQRYKSRRTGAVLAESGLLYTERPGRMRWEYQKPETKLFILADGLGWYYLPEDQVVYRMNTAAGGTRRLPSLFLAGAGDLNRDFVARTIAGADTALRLELKPRTLGESYEYLLLDIDPKSFALNVLTVVDSLDNRTEYEFRDERPNPVLPARAFHFAVPEGVDVVDADPR